MIKEALEILKEHERTVYCLRVDSRTQYHDGDLEMPLVGLRGFFSYMQRFLRSIYQYL